MKKKAQIIIGVIIVFLLGIIMAATLYLTNHVPENPAGTVGNTAGNLNNFGLFCEYDGTVYFSNSFDGGSLFSMNPDESNMKRLNTSDVQNILAGGKFLYYFQTGSSFSGSEFGQLDGMKSFNRCSLNGSGATGLTKDTVTCAQLVDNFLYLMTATNSGVSFNKMNIDGSDEIALANYVINPACAQNGIIYFNGTKGDHYLYKLNTTNDVVNEVWKGNLWYPVVADDYVYYLDVANNYRICRYSMTMDVVEVLTNDRVDCFNVGNGYIYYQTNGSDPQLKCMRVDGSDATVVANGVYTAINMTSRYVYFKQFGDDTTTYHCNIGSSNYAEFSAAKVASEE